MKVWMLLSLLAQYIYITVVQGRAPIISNIYIITFSCIVTTKCNIVTLSDIVTTKWSVVLIII